MNVESDKLILGQINGVFGVQGWLKIFSHTDPRENILTYPNWLIKYKGQWQPIKLVEGKSQQGGKTVVAKLAGFNDRDKARELMGADIAILKSELPDADDGIYWVQLIGCEVVNLQNENLGVVTSLVETGAHDVLRVEKDGNSTLIPYVKDEFILGVDTEQKTISVDWTVEDDS
jgi:16S rRNA processing protein RimM